MAALGNVAPRVTTAASAPRGRQHTDEQKVAKKLLDNVKAPVFCREDIYVRKINNVTCFEEVLADFVQNKNTGIPVMGANYYRTQRAKWFPDSSAHARLKPLDVKITPSTKIVQAMVACKKKS